MWLLLLILPDIPEKYTVNINTCEDISTRTNNYKMSLRKKRLELASIFVFLFSFLAFKGFSAYGLAHIKL